MSRRSRRKRRRNRAARVGHGRGKGVRTIWLNPPGISAGEIIQRLLLCLPDRVGFSQHIVKTYGKNGVLVVANE